MKRSTWLVAMGAMLAVAAGQATVTQAENAQQQKMKTCNADAKAKSLSGDARKTYMKSCLSDQPVAAATGNSQQEKMRTCNADAKSQSLKGPDRKTFMSNCLKGSAAPH